MEGVTGTTLDCDGALDPPDEWERAAFDSLGFFDLGSREVDETPGPLETDEAPGGASKKAWRSS